MGFLERNPLLLSTQTVFFFLKLLFISMRPKAKAGRKQSRLSWRWLLMLRRGKGLSRRSKRQSRGTERRKKGQGKIVATSGSTTVIWKITVIINKKIYFTFILWLCRIVLFVGNSI